MTPQSQTNEEIAKDCCKKVPIAYGWLNTKYNIFQALEAKDKLLSEAYADGFARGQEKKASCLCGGKIVCGLHEPMINKIESDTEERYKGEIAYWKQEVDIVRLQRMDREKDLAQLQQLVDGIDVDNPSAVDTLIDALKIQKSNLNQKIQDLQQTLSQKEAEITRLKEKYE